MSAAQYVVTFLKRLKVRGFVMGVSGLRKIENYNCQVWMGEEKRFFIVHFCRFVESPNEAKFFRLFFPHEFFAVFLEVQTVF